MAKRVRKSAHATSVRQSGSSRKRECREIRTAFADRHYLEDYARYFLLLNDRRDVRLGWRELLTIVVTWLNVAKPFLREQMVTQLVTQDQSEASSRYLIEDIMPMSSWRIAALIATRVTAAMITLIAIAIKLKPNWINNLLVPVNLVYLADDNQLILRREHLKSLRRFADTCGWTLHKMMTLAPVMAIFLLDINCRPFDDLRSIVIGIVFAAMDILDWLLVTNIASLFWIYFALVIGGFLAFVLNARATMS